MAIVTPARGSTVKWAAICSDASRSRRRTKVMRAALVLLVLASSACSRTIPSATDRLHPCEINEGPPDAYCGQLTVFEDRVAKQGRTIDLKIVVAPALRRDPKPDPLFIFEGGPG